MFPKKIAIYSGVVPSTTFIERLITGLASRGMAVYVFGSQSRQTSYSKNVFCYTYSGKWSKLFQLLQYSFLLAIFKPRQKQRLDQIIRDKGGKPQLLKIKFYPVLYHQPDIFHLQWAKGIAEWSWVREFGISLVLSLRGTHITISPAADAKLLSEYCQYFPEVDGFHAVSQSIARTGCSFGADRSKIQVVYSGLDLPDFPFTVKKEKSQALTVLSIGRSHWVKGYSHALDAMALLQQNTFSFHYTIIGVQDDEELFFQRDQLGLQKTVSFKEQLSFAAVMHAIQSADVLLLPSVEEGIANVVLEAMALGTLVVTTHCGGMEEVVEDGINGFAVPVRNPQAMAQAIRKAASLPAEVYLEMCLKARTTIERQHDASLMVSGMMELYESL